MSACCFGGEPAEDQELKRKKQQLADLKAEADALDKAASGLATGKYAMASLGGAEVEAAAAKALPMTIPAKSLDSRVGGTITISSLTGVTIGRERVSFTMSGRGRRIQVPSAAALVVGQKKVDQYKAAVESGMTVLVQGKVTSKRGKLMFHGRAKKVTLKKHKKLANDVKNALNQSFFARPHPINLGKLNGYLAHGVVVEGDEVAIVFTP